MRFHHNNSHRTKRSSSARTSWRVRLTMLGAAVIVAVAGVVPLSGGADVAYARDYDAEIKALQNQIDDYNKRASELAAQSNTLQGRISQLQNQQAELQAQINLSSAEQARLEQQIADAEAKIKAQATALSQNLENQYYSSQTSALDVLMNSNSVSDYVDRQTRQQAMSDQITDAVSEIKQAKKELEAKKAEVEEVIKKQTSQKQELANSQAEQQQLLDQTQGQEARYQELVSETEAKKAQVQAEQQAAIRRYQQSHSGGWGNAIVSSQCGGGYPFCNATPDSYQSAGGFYAYGNARECVNYVQWRIFQLTGRNERHGNAGSWSDVANSSAKANTVGIIDYGSLPYGHVVWVEEVGTGEHAGQVYISEYNWSPYAYTERWASISSFTGGFYDPLK